MILSEGIKPMPWHLIQSLGAAEPSSVQSLPWVAHAVVGASLTAGVILWLSGGKLLKLVFSALGALIGGGIGFLLLPAATTSSMFTIPSPYVGLVIGAAVGLLAGVALFRFAVAISTGVAFGIAGLLISATYLSVTVGMHSARPSAVPTAAGGPPTSPEPAHNLTEATKRMVDEGVKPVAQRVHRFVSDNGEQLKAQWEAQTEHNKVALGVSTLGAGLFGFFISLFAPKRSTALATALFGSAVVLGCSLWLLKAFDAPGQKYLSDQGPMVWLAAWMVAAVLGLAVQLRAGKPHKAPPAAPA